MAHRKNRVIVDYTGKDLFILAGLPRDVLDDVKRYLSDHQSRGLARYEGAPAPIEDTRPLYSDSSIAIMIEQAVAFADKGRDKDTTTPRRIIALYVPSHDRARFERLFGFFAYAAPLRPLGTEWQPQDGGALAWRHYKYLVRTVVERAIDEAIKITNILKAEITDRNLTPLCLPSRNFYYPDTNSLIELTYLALVQKAICRYQSML